MTEKGILFTTYSLLLTLYYLLFTTYSLLLTLYYLLFITGLTGTTDQ